MTEDTNKLSKNLFQNGWDIFKCENISYLNRLREEIHKSTQEIFNYNNKDIKNSFDNFHLHTKDLNDADLNEKKIKLINKISKDTLYVDLIYNSFENLITNFIGNDVLVQKTINIVIQPPNDKNPTIPHRDAPPNSFYEMVLWIPLTDCSETKSMYIINKQDGEKSLELLDKESEWENFISSLSINKKYPKVKYGEALIFMPSIYHGSDTNLTDETRFALNIRFKNLFTPSGKKFPLHFFRPYKVSEFTRFAIDSNKKEILINSKYE